MPSHNGVDQLEVKLEGSKHRLCEGLLIRKPMETRNPNASTQAIRALLKDPSFQADLFTIKGIKKGMLDFSYSTSKPDVR